MTQTHFTLLPHSLPASWPKELPAAAYLGIVVWAEPSAKLIQDLSDLFSDALPRSNWPAGQSSIVRAFRPGVTNPMSQSLAKVLGIQDAQVRVDQVIVWAGTASALKPESLQRLEWLWREPAIEDLHVLPFEDWLKKNQTQPRPEIREDDSFRTGKAADFDLEFESAEEDALQNEAIRRGRPWNRAELEVFAQTWSEHCKHKIFGARIRTKDTLLADTDGLFKTHIRQPTIEIQEKRPGRYLSVFHDNAGVLALDAVDGTTTDWAVCLKMETHNSPSAISPYGGASTGIVGVHRDILGTGIGALPIANWDVLCFESPQHDQGRPSNALPPDVLRKGVIKGIEDGGNQSGIPTVQGSVVFDPRYAVKPLVYAGSVGLMPRSAVDKKPKPGLALYCLGGATGADGLRGAVMSSRDLRAGDFRGSAVQVASPFIQRCLTDFLMDARDQGLIDVLTDNGAGGLASSVGEMAGLTNGADIDLSHVRLKFEGLHAWERLLSESQERMTLATDQPERLESLARAWRVPFDRLGQLTDSGHFTVRYDGKVLVDIEIAFLHKGCPRLELESQWTAAQESAALDAESAARPQKKPDVITDFSRMLRSEHLCSREGIVRAFDHEVQGRTLRKPFGGRDQNTPQDGSLMEIFEAGRAGFVLAHGLSPQRADIAENVVHSFDEALRAAVLSGLRWESAGALDNFCWPDPITRSQSELVVHRRLWRLVRSCEVLSTLCRSWDIPLVSGKDSMKNNSRDFAVPETIVVSVGGSASTLSELPSGYFSRANEIIAWIPPLGLSLRDSAWERTLGTTSSEGRTTLFSSQDPLLLDGELKSLAAQLKDRYARLSEAISKGWVRSAKDISEGGMLTSVFEMCLGRGLGVHFESWNDDAVSWLGEGLGGFVLGIDPHLMRELQDLLPEMRRLGITLNVPVLRWGVGRELSMEELKSQYVGPGKEGFWR